MDNKSAFNVSDYDKKVRSVIPFYDDIHDQIIRLANAYFSDKPIDFLDTGCGTGTFAKIALDKLNIRTAVLCDPSEKMLADAEKNLECSDCQFILRGSEEINDCEKYDLITAVQSHHYFSREQREKAVSNCYRALKKGGLFISFENTAPFTDTGKQLLLSRMEQYGREQGRSEDEIKGHSGRYGKEFFPINPSEHLELLRNTGFNTAEIFWLSYLQMGMYAIK